MDEIQQRISFLNEGPWIKKGKKAWAIIGKRPKQSEKGDVGRKQRELRSLLRAHWDDETSYDEGIIRDSFDEALTVYQLYELAIETGYLSLEDIQDRVRAELTNLLWSDGARHYLINYSYTAVAYLAQRVGVDLGFKEVALPNVREGTEGRFASFLSQHVLWYDDQLLDDWIAFLDDYQSPGDEEESDKELFWQFLRTKDRTFADETTLWKYVAGADRLVMRLSELAQTLSESEKPSYGMFYAYWMQKLYGYDLRKRGYVRDREQVDWPAELTRSRRLAHQVELAEKQEKSGRRNNLAAAIGLFAERDKAVREFWDITKKQLDSDPIKLR